MKNNLYANTEGMVNLINFLTLADDINNTEGTREIYLGDKIVTTKLETCHYGNKDIKSLIISNDEGKNIRITLTRKFNNYTQRHSYMDVLCTSYVNYLSVDFYENTEDAVLSLDFTLTHANEDKVSFKPITQEFYSAINKSSLTYTVNRDVVMSYVINVPYTKEEKEKYKIPSYATRYKAKREYKDTKESFTYKVSKDLKTVTKINNENPIFHADYELKNKNINVKSEINEFVSKLPYYSNEELDYILNELLKEYTISPVKMLKKSKKLDYRNVVFD